VSKKSRKTIAFDAFLTEHKDSIV